MIAVIFSSGDRECICVGFDDKKVFMRLLLPFLRVRAKPSEAVVILGRLISCPDAPQSQVILVWPHPTGNLP